MKRNNKRGGDDSDSSPARPATNHADVPFRDGDPSVGELPLDDIDTFIHAAADDRGIKARLSFSVPPYMERLIQIILRSGRFPYLRDSDFIRHAVYRHIHFCVGLRHSIPRHIVPTLDAMTEICRDDEIRHRMQECFEKIETRVRYLQSRAEYGEMIRLINLVKTRLNELPPSQWQRKFQKEFESKYNRHLDGSGVDIQRAITGESPSDADAESGTKQ